MPKDFRPFTGKTEAPRLPQLTVTSRSAGGPEKLTALCSTRVKWPVGTIRPSGRASSLIRSTGKEGSDKLAVSESAILEQPDDSGEYRFRFAVAEPFIRPACALRPLPARHVLRAAHRRCEPGAASVATAPCQARWLSLLAEFQYRTMHIRLSSGVAPTRPSPHPEALPPQPWPGAAHGMR